MAHPQQHPQFFQVEIDPPQNGLFLAGITRFDNALNNIQRQVLDTHGEGEPHAFWEISRSSPEAISKSHTRKQTPAGQVSCLGPFALIDSLGWNSGEVLRKDLQNLIPVLRDLRLADSLHPAQRFPAGWF